MSLSADGTRVAIGATDNDGSGNDVGHVRIYEFKLNSYADLSGNTLIVKKSTVNDGASVQVNVVQAESEQYLEGTASDSFAITKATPTITVVDASGNSLGNTLTKQFGDSLTLIPSSSSTGAFTFLSSDPSAASIDANGVVTLLRDSPDAVNMTTITITQAEDANFNSATFEVVLTVNRATTIVDPSYVIQDVVYAPDLSFNLARPSTNQDEPIGNYAWDSQTPTVATVTTGGFVTILKAGNAFLRFTQGGTQHYTQTTNNYYFTVFKADPVIVDNLPRVDHREVVPLTGITSTSDASFNFTSSAPEIADISGNNLLLKEVGTTIITVSQDATDNYNAWDASFVFISNICFPAGTPIQCDQGIIAIEKMDPSVHTIRGKKVVGITRSVSLYDKYLVCLKKDCVAPNVPSQDTVMTKTHQVFFRGQMVKAGDLVKRGVQGVEKVKYNDEVLYNVLMEKHDKMLVNNLICETLHPEHDIAKAFVHCQSLSDEEKREFCQWYNYEFKQRNKSAKRR